MKNPRRGDRNGGSFLAFAPWSGGDYAASWLSALSQAIFWMVW